MRTSLRCLFTRVFTRVFTLVFALALAAFAATPALAAKDVVLAVSLNFSTTDPYDANDVLSQAMAKSFYEGLFGFDKDMKLIPVLADGYSVSKDGLVYTIKLKQGVKFHDGTDFKADAVKANLDRVTDPANKLKRYALYNGNIAKTEVMDDYTARITLKTAFSPFINQLAHPSSVMISPAALKKYGNKDIAVHPVGTGPFKFVEWKTADYLKVEKFDGYWKKGLPKVDTITWKSVPEGGTRASMLQTGEAHYAALPYELADTIKARSGLEVVTAPSIMIRFLTMNTLQKPFDNPKVREAISFAINRDALIKVAFAGYGVPAPGYVPAMVEHAVKTTLKPYDVARAKQLLAEAGYPNGFETELWSAYASSTARKVVEFLQQQLLQVGIRGRITILEAGQRVQQVESWQDPATAPVRLFYLGWSSSTGEADWALRPLLYGESAPPRSMNTAYYRSAKFDAAIKAAQLTNDSAEKAKLYREAQETATADMPWVPLIVEQQLYARSKHLSGFYVMPDSSLNFSDIDLN
jgi:glutathione transport system substrate-binding protein